MNFATKGVLTLGFVASAAFSHAALNYSNIVAQITFDGTQTYNLNVSANGNSLDFSALNYPMYVASVNSLYTSAVVTITYDVTSDKGINGLDLIFTGMTLGNGTVDYTESVKDTGGNVLDSVSGTMSGNNSFIGQDTLSFSAQNAYSVEKTFTLGLGNQAALAPGSPSFASIGLIEQNAVPEPATLGAVGVGLVSLLARRRRK